MSVGLGSFLFYPPIRPNLLLNPHNQINLPVGCIIGTFLAQVVYVKNVIVVDNVINSIIRKIRNWIAIHELQSAIKNEEISQLYKAIPQVVRESHETYKLGDFTVTVVGSKAELDNRRLITRVNKDKAARLAHDKMIDLAFTNLVFKADE